MKTNYKDMLIARAKERQQDGHPHKALDHIQHRNKRNLSAWRRRFAACSVQSQRG